MHVGQVIKNTEQPVRIRPDVRGSRGFSWKGMLVGLLAACFVLPSAQVARAQGAAGLDGESDGQTPQEIEAPEEPPPEEPGEPREGTTEAGSTDAEAAAEHAPDQSTAPETAPPSDTAPEADTAPEVDTTPPSDTTSESSDPSSATEPTVPTPPSGEDEAPEPADAPARLVAVVIDAAPYGIDPVVGEHVSMRMRTTAEELGYEVVSHDDSVQAAQRLSMPYPPTPADLWRVTFVAGAQRGAFARVWAHNGRYVIELTVASADGTGPFFARATAGADDLHEVVERLTREAMPAPAQYDQEAAARIATSRTSPEETPAQPQLEPILPSTAPPLRIRPPRRAREQLRPTRRWDLAIQTESAIGISEDSFYNHLIGVRIGYRLTNTMMLRLYGAYANLRGRGQRAQNFLPMLQFEKRIRIASRIDLSVPLRVSVGYLPFNGPVLRFSAGLNLPISSRFELGIDLMAPTVWFLPNQSVASLNIALELMYRL